MILSRIANRIIGVSIFLGVMAGGVTVFEWLMLAHPIPFAMFLPLWFLFWVVSLFILQWLVGKILGLIFVKFE